MKIRKFQKRYVTSFQQLKTCKRLWVKLKKKLKK